MSTTVAAPEDVSIESVEDLEEVVDQLGDARSELSKKEAEKEQAVRKIQRKYKPQIERRQEKVEVLEAAAVEFCKEHRDELLEEADGKTVNLITGEVQFRAGSDTVAYDDSKQNIIDRLKQAGHENLVVKKETLHKSVLKKHRAVCESIQGLRWVEGEESIIIKPLTF